ncbi:MAG: fasciclin domain-containing protein, partial [Bacteroidota bacterium]
ANIDLNAVSDEDLADILRYHVVAGGTIFRTANIPEGTTAVNTINTEGPNSDGLAVSVERSGGSVTVNNANVIVADVDAVNGVIHAIDQVLLPPTLTSTAVADGRFTTLVAALQRTGLDDVLNGNGNFTVFAPTDAAFAEANIDLDNVTDEDLSALLLYHVVGAGIPAGAIASGDNFVASLSETGPDDAALSLLVNQTDGAVTINGDASVVIADVFTSNGIIHAVDKVLTQQSIVDFATKAEGLSTLATNLVDAGLVGTLSDAGPFTVFAPVNSAFEAIEETVRGLSPEQVTAVLTYHVVSGVNVRSDAIPAQAATFNGETLVFSGDNNSVIRTGSNQNVTIDAVDIQGTNGVVHLIGTVLIPENL